MAQPWYPGETLSAGIGQGYMLTTPMQLAVATNALATRGEHRSPRLVRAINNELVEAPLLERVPGTPENWAAVHDGMHAVVHSARGSARKIAKGIQYEVGGKTGKLGDKVQVSREKAKINVTAEAPFSKQYLKYCRSTKFYYITKCFDHYLFSCNVRQTRGR